MPVSTSVRVIAPPLKPGINPITVGGRGTTYSAPAGSVVDAPWGDAVVLIANGWAPIGHGLGLGNPLPALVGVSAQRPTGDGDRPLPVGAQYCDTTLGKVITWDGYSAWRDMAGSTV
jgi:hypothetical protein